MKKILLKDYQPSMGTFIDVNYNDGHIVGLDWEPACHP